MALPNLIPTTLPPAAQEITVVSISDLHTIPLSNLYIPPGDILIVAGDLSEGRPAHLMQRLSELCILPHTVKIIIGGNHDRALDANCDARDVAIYNDLSERQECRAAFRQAKESGIIYLEDESTHVIIAGRTFKVFGSPKSLATLTNTAFGYSEDDDFSWWEIIPPDVDILVTHGPPAGYLSDDRNGCDGLLKALWRVRPMLHVFGHVHSSYGATALTYDDVQKASEVQHRSRISKARDRLKLQQAESGGRYIPRHLRCKQSSGLETTTSQHDPSDFPAEDLLKAPVLVPGQTRLINAAVKTSGPPRGAIVVKIL
ncbi:Metallo-dependent phosphatase-like protein [Tuber indicum]|nr:Metallo-dependent phosphatase-like protein [Tuber indicum]